MNQFPHIKYQNVIEFFKCHLFYVESVDKKSYKKLIQNNIIRGKGWKQMGREMIETKSIRVMVKIVWILLYML